MPAGVTEEQITKEAISHALRFPEVYRTWQQEYADPGTAAELAERRGHRLASLLERILTQVPVFRDLGVTWKDEDPFAVLAGLPTMSKADLLADPMDRISDEFDPADCTAVVTSGTTGQPLRIIHSREHLVHVAAAELSRVLRSGLPFDRRTLLPFMAGAGLWREYTMANAGFSRVVEFGFLDQADKADRARVARRCAAFEPHLLLSHPPRLVAFAALLEEAGVRLTVPIVQTFGVTLTDPVRETLRTAFGGQVRDQYGMNEANLLAAECAEGRMHVDANRLHLEIHDDQGNAVPEGTAGEVVVTNFFNAVMPFVRYRTGDIASLSSGTCACGDPAPVLSLLAGRNHGVIRFADGGTIDGLRVVRALERLPLQQIQVIQTDVDLITVLATPLPSHDDWQALAAAAARAAVGDRINVEIRTADAADYHRPKGDKVAAFVPLSDRPTGPVSVR